MDKFVPRITITGHSFVRDLQKLCSMDPDWFNLGLNPAQQLISFQTDYYDPNTNKRRKILFNQDLLQAVDDIYHNYHPHIVMIDCGSNDVCSADIQKADQDDLFDMAIQIVNRFTEQDRQVTKRVVWLQQLPRTAEGNMGLNKIFHCRNLVKSSEPLDWSIFNQWALQSKRELLFATCLNAYNQPLYLTGLHHPFLKALCQSGIMGEWRDHICKDGVHLNYEGLIKYARNMHRQAIYQCGCLGLNV